MNDKDKQAGEDPAKQTGEERIEVGYRNIGSVMGKDYHHKYLLYTDREGNQQTISAWTGEEAPGLPYGKLQVEANKPYDATNPDHPGNANATGQRQHREVIATGADLSQTWQKMVADAQSKDDRYPYDPQLQNSNTLADSVLRSAGLPEPKKDGFTEHWAPASGRKLDENIEPKVPGLGNSGRSFSTSDQSFESRRTDTAPEATDDIRKITHRGNPLYQQAIDSIERSPNIPPGTFTGERLEQAAANLVNVSTAGADRPQGGRNEVLERIDFAVFNKPRDGLIAGQGDYNNAATAKLAYLPAAQDNDTTLAMASQKVHETLQRTQAQTLGNTGQSLDKTQEQGSPNIGPRAM
jgi:hypothetical protein